jgi:hypothetical protein
MFISICWWEVFLACRPVWVPMEWIVVGYLVIKYVLYILNTWCEDVVGAVWDAPTLTSFFCFFGPGIHMARGYFGFQCVEDPARAYRPLGLGS